MRTNLISMLDGIGLHQHLEIESTASLFAERRDLLHGTSAILYPAFLGGRNYGGSHPPTGSRCWRRSSTRSWRRSWPGCQTPSTSPSGEPSPFFGAAPRPEGRSRHVAACSTSPSLGWQRPPPTPLRPASKGHDKPGRQLGRLNTENDEHGTAATGDRSDTACPQTPGRGPGDRPSRDAGPINLPSARESRCVVRRAHQGVHHYSRTACGQQGPRPRPVRCKRSLGTKREHYVGGTVAGVQIRARASTRKILVGASRSLLAIGRFIQARPSRSSSRRTDHNAATLAPDLRAALESHPVAGAFFDSLAQFYRKGYIR
ncbi:MAG: hypothetical protein QOF30_3632 [Acidimicrobiaceae bacterium]|nr:hypothetical protein [Acidimicrobiaceae bacterium]